MFQLEVKMSEFVFLVADDEPFILNLIEYKLLHNFCCKVLRANDGIKAVELFRKNCEDVDLVILDLLMPGLSGGEAFIEIRKLNKNVPVLFCSAQVEECEYKETFKKSNNTYFINKPLEDKLITTIESILGCGACNE